jgi:hypothetical protein
MTQVDIKREQKNWSHNMIRASLMAGTVCRSSGISLQLNVTVVTKAENNPENVHCKFLF